MGVITAAVEVRSATERDLPGIDAVYEPYVRGTHITFDLEPLTPAERRAWFHHYAPTGPHRLLVAVDDDRVVGYACSSRWRPKRAYDTSVETSVYLARHAAGRGIGTALYEMLFDEIAGEGLHRAYAGIALPNPASLALHLRFGYQQVARFTEQGFKLGRFWDVAVYEKRLD